MRKFLELIDNIIRFPLNAIYYAVFCYMKLPDYTRDRIQLVFCGVLFSTFVYWAPFVFNKYIELFHDFLAILTAQLPKNSGSNGGLIYEYQTLIAGGLAILAGSLALFSPVLAHWFEKYKKRREFIIRLRGWAITTNVEVLGVLNSENPLDDFNMQRLQNLQNQKPTFFKNDFYWCFSDGDAFLADSIEKKINQGNRWIVRMLDGVDDNDTVKRVRLDCALHSFSSALIDADKFMAATLEGHLQIIEYCDNPDIAAFQARRNHPVRLAMTR